MDAEHNELRVRISELISKVDSLEYDQKWGEASGLYKEMIGCIDEYAEQKYAGNRAGLSDWEKEQVVNCWIGYYNCRFQITKTPSSEIWEYDSSKRVRQWIRELEEHIGVYHFDKRRLWNNIQCKYDQWGKARRNAGLKYEADEFQFQTLRARRNWMYVKLTLRGNSKNVWNWISNLFALVRTTIEWALFGVGKGLFLPFAIFVMLPILLASFVFYFSNCIVIDPITTQPGNLTCFFYSLSYSVFVFTGSEAGPISACSSHPWVIYAMAFEAIFGLVFMVVIVGYLVNRLSSR